MTTTVRPLLAVVPARGGSKGLPGKNIRPLAGLPLLVHSLRCAGLVPLIERTIVSTDSAEIASVARAYGADVPFLRPAALATDAAPMWPVVRHALEEIERQEGRRYESVLLLDPTSPGRLPDDIVAAVERLAADDECDGVVGVASLPFNPLWHCVVERDDGYLRDLVDGAAGYARRQDVPPVYRIDASLYCWRREFVLRAADWRAGRLRLHVVPEARTMHIDDLAQFELAELKLAHGLCTFPWLDGASVSCDRFDSSARSTDASCSSLAAPATSARR